jgi:Methane oxygenase PmoA
MTTLESEIFHSQALQKIMKAHITPQTSIVLTDENSVQRFSYNFSSNRAPKPFIHPLRLPTGEVITEEAPTDHIWHRGIWFAWKFVNGVNYWEERDAVIGKQRGITPPTIAQIAPNTHLLTHQLSWHDDDENAEATRRLTENRQLMIIAHTDGTLQIDWESRFYPTEDTILDRTPYTTWGGYGGLVTRLAKEASDTQIIFADGTRTQRPTGESYLWGGIEGSINNTNFAIAFLPHPENIRFPEPFYGNANEKSNFFGPAPLFHEPLSLKKGTELRHRVRLLILPTKVTNDIITPYYWGI